MAYYSPYRTAFVALPFASGTPSTEIHYKMDDDAATTVVIDSIGTSNGTSVQNTEDISTTGLINEGFTFDGVADYIDCNATVQALFRDSFTVLCWVKPTDGQPASSKYLFGTINAAGEDGVYAWIDTDGKINCKYFSDGDEAYAQTADVIFEDGVVSDFTFVTFEFSADIAIAITVNNVVVDLDSTNDGDATACTFVDYTSSDNVYVGALNNNSVAEGFYAGTMDDFRILDDVLTDAIRTGLYNNGYGTEETSAIIYSAYAYTNSVDLTRKKHLIAVCTDELIEMDTNTGTATALNYYTEGTIEVTNGSADVYASGTVVEDGENAWTAEANVTCDVDTTYKELGTNSAKITIADAFGTGIVAYEDLAAGVDLTDIKCLRCFIRSDVALDAGDMQIILYDTAGKTNEVLRFDVPAVLADTNTRFYAIPALYNTDNDISDINCIALNQVVDKGACNIYIDNVQMIESEFTGNVQANDILSIDSFVTEYTIDSVDSYGKLTLSENYDETTDTESAYKIKYPLTEDVYYDYATFKNNLIGTNYTQYPFHYDGTKFYRYLIDDAFDASGVTAVEQTDGSLTSGTYLYKFAWYDSVFGETKASTDTVTVTSVGGKQILVSGFPRPTWKYDQIRVYRTKDSDTDYFYNKTISAFCDGFYDDTEDVDLDDGTTCETDGLVQEYCRYLGVASNRLIQAHTRQTDEYRSKFRYLDDSSLVRTDGASWKEVKPQDGDQINAFEDEWLDAMWFFKERAVYAVSGTTVSDWGLFKSFAFEGTKSPNAVVKATDHKMYYPGSRDAHIRMLAGARSETSQSIDNVVTEKLTHPISDFIETIDLSKSHLFAGIEDDNLIIISCVTEGDVPNRAICIDRTVRPYRFSVDKQGMTSYAKDDDNVLYGTDGESAYIYKLNDGYADDGADIDFYYLSPSFQTDPVQDVMLENIKVQYDSASTGTLSLKIYTEGTLVHTELIDLETYPSYYAFNPPRALTKGRYQQLEIEESSQNAFALVNMQLRLRMTADSYR